MDFWTNPIVWKPAPLEDLSPEALRALVKLLLASGTLSVSRAAPYVELQRAGWAYRVASVPNGFVFNDDNRQEILQMLHLAK